MTDAPLPRDWHQLLDRFADTLAGVQQRLATATTWENSGADVEHADVHVSALEGATARHAGLHDQVMEISRWADAIESELRVSEDLLRMLLNQTETIRQKLATWARRAIG